MTASPSATKLLALLLALAGSMIFLSPALADPMKCSGEENTCITACKKAARTAITTCITACGARGAACRRTGCWDNGVQRYCGLSKQ